MPAAVRVLVVDDSVTIRAMMTQVLQRDPAIKVVSASSADEADRLLADGGLFDVMTLDVTMPDIDGMTYLRRLTARGADVPVVMLSASTGRGADIRIAALLAGAVGCFDKADAMRAAPELIRLIKAAARHRAKIDAEDAVAIEAVRQ